MKKNNFQDLLTSVDVLNTINGGISEPSVIFHQQADGRELRARVPGMEKEALQAEVHNNTLSVFYLIPITVREKVVQMPQVVYSKTIPYYVDISGIRAEYEGQELVVRMPFNELSSGYHKKLTIDEE
jgi:HSP20 family molecular chaperone IbpA